MCLVLPNVSPDVAQSSSEIPLEETVRFERVLSIILVALIPSACSGGSGDGITMPDVIGKRLDVALSDIERAGFSADVEVVGGGTFGVIDESNWLVCEQVPAAGLAVSDPPRLAVERTCPEDGTPAEDDASITSGAPVTDQAPAASSAAASSSTDPKQQGLLTVATSEELAEVLSAADTDNDLFAEFADRYEGWLVEFDGHIADLTNHDGTETRFDILILAGDYGSPEIFGPYFQFRDVNIVNDLNLVGSNIPDSLGRGDNLRVVARIIGFEPGSGLLLLEPVETRVR